MRRYLLAASALLALAACDATGEDPRTIALPEGVNVADPTEVTYRGVLPALFGIPRPTFSFVGTLPAPCFGPPFVNVLHEGGSPRYDVTVGAFRTDTVCVARATRVVHDSVALEFDLPPGAYSAAFARPVGDPLVVEFEVE